MFIKRVLGFINNYNRAKKVLAKIKKKNPSQKLVLAFPHLGDIVLGLAYLQELNRDETVIVIPYKMKFLINLYNGYFNNVEYLSDAETKSLLFCACGSMSRNVFDLDENNIVTFPHKFFNNGIINHIRGGALFAIRYAYGLNAYQQYDITYPSVPEISQERVQSILNCNQESLSRIIIISPYAQSAENISADIWNRIISELIDLGYVIYSNVMPEQKELKNTMRLECSLNELFNICKYIKVFIGLRSGVFDFIISSRCPIIAIYSLVSSIQSYTLTQWNIESKLREIPCDTNTNVAIETIEFVKEL